MSKPSPAEIENEINRQLRGSALVLAALTESRGKWVANLYKRTGCMVHSRVADLRRKGHLIECRYFGPGDYRYRLK